MNNITNFYFYLYSYLKKLKIISKKYLQSSQDLPADYLYPKFD